MVVYFINLYFSPHKILFIFLMIFKIFLGGSNSGSFNVGIYNFVNEIPLLDFKFQVKKRQFLERKFKREFIIFKSTKLQVELHYNHMNSNSDSFRNLATQPI